MHGCALMTRRGLAESETKTTWRNVAEPAGVPLHLLRDHNGAPVYAYHRADAERACKQAEMAEETAKASEGKATDSKTKPADSMPSMTAGGAGGRRESEAQGRARQGGT